MLSTWLLVVVVAPWRTDSNLRAQAFASREIASNAEAATQRAVDDAQSLQSEVSAKLQHAAAERQALQASHQRAMAMLEADTDRRVEAAAAAAEQTTSAHVNLAETEAKAAQAAQVAKYVRFTHNSSSKWVTISLLLLWLSYMVTCYYCCLCAVLFALTAWLHRLQAEHSAAVQQLKASAEEKLRATIVSKDRALSNAISTLQESLKFAQQQKTSAAVRNNMKTTTHWVLLLLFLLLLVTKIVSVHGWSVRCTAFAHPRACSHTRARARTHVRTVAHHHKQTIVLTLRTINTNDTQMQVEDIRARLEADSAAQIAAAQREAAATVQQEVAQAQAAAEQAQWALRRDLLDELAAASRAHDAELLQLRNEQQVGWLGGWSCLCCVCLRGYVCACMRACVRGGVVIDLLPPFCCRPRRRPRRNASKKWSKSLPPALRPRKLLARKSAGHLRSSTLKPLQSRHAPTRTASQASQGSCC